MLKSRLPKWALGSKKLKDKYYKLHQGFWLEGLIRWLSDHLGFTINGYLSQKALKKKLDQCRIQKVVAEGPNSASSLSSEAQALIFEALFPFEKVIDIHLHNLGYDEGNFLNPAVSAWGLASWKNYFKFLVIRNAAGITTPLGSTKAARRRIHLYASHFPKLRGFILPIHYAVSSNHKALWNKTCSYLTNTSAYITAKTFRSRDSKLYAAASISPLDKNWEKKLKKAYRRGIRLIKWMPPQGIQPDSEDTVPFYKALASLKIALISHSGPEHTFPSTRKWTDWGNPLRFRTALKLGVDVILAHCGHGDLMPDLDDPQQKERHGYELFARLVIEASENHYKGKLYGDLAAVPTHYGPEIVKKLLEYSQNPAFRIVYGSDYPFTNVIQPGNDAYVLMAEEGLIQEEIVKPLQEIRDWNPLLANFIFTRGLTLKKDSKNIRFPEETFTGKFAGSSLENILHY